MYSSDVVVVYERVMVVCMDGWKDGVRVRWMDGWVDVWLGG